MAIDVSDANVGRTVEIVDGSREIGDKDFKSLIQREGRSIPNLSRAPHPPKDRTPLGQGPCTIKVLRK
jgi:hypothetical protein